MNRGDTLSRQHHIAITTAAEIQPILSGLERQQPLALPGRRLDDDAIAALQWVGAICRTSFNPWVLAAPNTRQARVDELHYFGGLNEEETAEALKVSLRTVQRDWNLARLWFYQALTDKYHDEPPIAINGLHTKCQKFFNTPLTNDNPRIRFCQLRRKIVNSYTVEVPSALSHMKSHP